MVFLSFLKVSRGNVMAGRKRKMLALTPAGTPEETVNKQIDLVGKISPAKLKKPIHQSEDNQSAETEKSHYFTKKDPQHRLGDEFFNQPCISLAKALLGKVMLTSYQYSTGIHVVRLISKSRLMLCKSSSEVFQRSIGKLFQKTFISQSVTL